MSKIQYRAVTCNVITGGVSFPIKFNAYKEQANITHIQLIKQKDYFDMPSVFLFHHGHMSQN